MPSESRGTRLASSAPHATQPFNLALNNNMMVCFTLCTLRSLNRSFTSGNLYCKRCHGANFGIGGYGYGGGGTFLRPFVSHPHPFLHKRTHAQHITNSFVAGGALSSHKYNTNVHGMCLYELLIFAAQTSESTQHQRPAVNYCLYTTVTVFLRSV